MCKNADRESSRNSKKRAIAYGQGKCHAERESVGDLRIATDGAYGAYGAALVRGSTLQSYAKTPPEAVEQMRQKKG